jgi:DNA-directed RNA polymerase subunit M/transcription elongation factor TFIIS
VTDTDTAIVAPLIVTVHPGKPGEPDGAIRLRRRRAPNGTLPEVVTVRLDCPACGGTENFKRGQWQESGDGSHWRYVACACGERFKHIEE